MEEKERKEEKENCRKMQESMAEKNGRRKEGERRMEEEIDLEPRHFCRSPGISM